MGRSEALKKSVRRYLEAQGYAQTTDSFVEGSLEDMVFSHPDEREKVAVEVKATRLSLMTKPFGVSLMGYFRQWQARPKNNRFRFWLFTQELKPPVKEWHAFFRGDGKLLKEWRSWYNTKCREEEEPELEAAELAALATFLKGSQVTVASNVLLDLATVEKTKTSAHSLVRSATTWLDTVKSRRLPPAKRSTMLLNIAPFSIPAQYYAARIAPEFEKQATELVASAAVPPLLWRKEGKFLTFVPLDDVNPLSAWLAGPAETRDTQFLQDQRPTLAARLVHSHMVDIWAARGVTADDDTLYFPLPTIAEETRSIRGPDGGLRQICRAMFHEKDTFKAKKGDLNFVFHQATEYGVRTYWGQTYLEIFPCRYYTSDGKTGIKGEAAARIDRSFYKPEWDRGPERIARTKLWHHAILDFDSFEKPVQPWFRLFGLGPLVERQVPWTPISTPRQQSTLDVGGAHAVYSPT